MLVRHENRGNFLFHAFFIVITFTHAGYSQGFKTFWQPSGPFVIDNVGDYLKSIAEDAAKGVVNLKNVVPQLVIDLKYSTKNNFFREVLYDKKPEAYARRSLAETLKKINGALAKKGLGLKVFDAYRPYSVTKKMWKVVPDERYAANPAKGSGHNRGAAIDVTLVKLSTGEELAMPTRFDDFTEKAHHNYRNLPKEVIRNRELLKDSMEANGLVSLSTEWWHYSLPDAAEQFELLDLSFEELKELQLH
jgi:D-alanyl-D-alanine dipeptidase